MGLIFLLSYYIKNIPIKMVIMKAFELSDLVQNL